MRTPLGRVLIARLQGPGAIEVAGPSAAADVRAVERRDARPRRRAGADRRRDRPPRGLLAGGVRRPGDGDGRGARPRHRRGGSQTRDAVDLVRLPLADDGLEPVALPPRFVLTADAEQIARAARREPDRALADRRGRAARTVPARPAASPAPPPARARAGRCRPHEGVPVETRTPVVSPAGRPPADARAHRAAGAHRQPASRPSRIASTRRELRALLEQAIPDVPIFDVLHPDYRGAGAATAAARSG